MSLVEAADALINKWPLAEDKFKLSGDAKIAELGLEAVGFKDIADWFNKKTACSLPENLDKAMQLADHKWFLVISGVHLELLGYRNFTEESLVRQANSQIVLEFGEQENKEIGLKALVLSGAISSGNDPWVLDITYRITDYREAYVAQAALVRVSEGRIINLSDAGQCEGKLFFRDANLAAGEQMSITYGRSGFNQINQKNVSVVDIPMTLPAKSV